MNAVAEIKIPPRLASLAFGSAQRHRVARLCEQRRTAVLWDGSSAVAPGSAVIVIDPAPPTRMQALVGALDPDAVVIIPYGEHPAFDTLKSKLAIHGSIVRKAPRRRISCGGAASRPWPSEPGSTAGPRPCSCRRITAAMSPKSS